MTIQDQQLELFTRLSLMLCIDRRDAVRVKRDTKGRILLIPSSENMRQFVGRGGSRIRALKALGAKMKNPESVHLTNASDDSAHTNAALFSGLDGVSLLHDLLNSIMGVEPQISDSPDEQNGRYRVWIPAQYHEPELSANLNEALLPISTYMNQKFGFTLIPV